jgi:hypothetical protein
VGDDVDLQRLWRQRADPNKVVQITEVSATTLTGPVTKESFSTLAGPTYGTVYGGVAYVNPH